MDKQLDLNNIRNILIRLEESIIFTLIERAQYKVNQKIYEKNAFEIPDFDGSFSDFYLYKSECADALIRRFTAPDQLPFFSDLPSPIIPVNDEKWPIIRTEINLNSEIKNLYQQKIVPLICKNGDDGQYGSGAMHDKMCLKSLSRRIHYGKFVAESKFLEKEGEYSDLVKKNNIAGILELLTDNNVENRIIERVQRKAIAYGQDPSDIAKNYKIAPEIVVEIYEKWIIPLTKKVEVQYLLSRVKK